MIRSNLASWGLRIVDVNPLKEEPSVFSRLVQRYHRRRGTKFWMERELSVARDYARQISDRIPRNARGVVFSTSTLPIAQLKATHPIVFWTDATFASLYDF